jgi:hypothetical protein
MFIIVEVSRCRYLDRRSIVVSAVTIIHVIFRRLLYSVSGGGYVGVGEDVGGCGCVCLCVWKKMVNTGRCMRKENVGELVAGWADELPPPNVCHFSFPLIDFALLPPRPRGVPDTSPLHRLVHTLYSTSTVLHMHG